MKIKKNKKEIDSRIFLLNKRDQIDEYIFNSVTNYNEYLLSKNKQSATDNFNSWIQEKNDFLAQTKIYLKKIDEMKIKILDKKSDFVASIKIYADNLIKKEKSLTEKIIAKTELDYNNEIKNIKHEIEKNEHEKINLKNEKNKNVEKIKDRIKKIHTEINDESKFDLSVEAKEVINLTDTHIKFINNDIKIKISDLSNKLEKLNKSLTQTNLKKIKDIYKITMDSKNRIKNEFLFLADIEKTSLKKMIKFKDFLEDVEYFANDKIEKYEILIANGKAIKAENFKNLIKDTNNLISFISNSESIFDNSDFLIRNIKKKIQDPSINNKLKEFQNSLLNSNSMKLIQNKDEKGEL